MNIIYLSLSWSQWVHAKRDEMRWDILEKHRVKTRSHTWIEFEKLSVLVISEMNVDFYHSGKFPSWRNVSGYNKFLILKILKWLY